MARKPILGEAPKRTVGPATDALAQDRDDTNEHSFHLGAKVPADVGRRYKLMAVARDTKVRNLIIEAIDLLEEKHGKV